MQHHSYGNFYIESKLCFANTYEKMTEKQLCKVKKRKNGNKPRISKTLLTDNIEPDP